MTLKKGDCVQLTDKGKRDFPEMPDTDYIVDRVDPPLVHVRRLDGARVPSRCSDRSNEYVAGGFYEHRFKKVDMFLALTRLALSKEVVNG